MNRVETLTPSALDSTLSSWSAAMIAPLCMGGYGSRASFITQTFLAPDVDQAVKLRISARRLYRAFVNGLYVGNDVLTPGLTC